jgi:hypothetical protein
VVIEEEVEEASVVDLVVIEVVVEADSVVAVEASVMAWTCLTPTRLSVRMHQLTCCEFFCAGIFSWPERTSKSLAGSVEWSCCDLGCQTPIM